MTLEKISKNTGVTVGLVIVLSSIIISGTWTIASMHWSIKANREDIVEIKPKLDYVGEALIRIEAKLGTNPPKD